VTLLEQRSLEEIASFFVAMHLRIVIHTYAPSYTPEELRRLPSEVRRELRRKDRPTHWAALAKPDGRIVARWYGSGDGDDDAIRSAARRWRVEQIGSEAENNPRASGGLP
jgi:hypothetical protein